jgi:hypothetical protein
MKTFNEQEWLEYRAKWPELRFWQALRGYMEVGYICKGDKLGLLEDTFYIKDK